MQQLCFAGWPVAGCLEESQLSKSIEWLKRVARRFSDSLNVGGPSMKMLAKIAMNADRLVQDVADQFNGNAARRHEMRMRAIEMGDQLRRQRWAIKHAKSNQALGRAPQGHRLMLMLTAKNHTHSV